MSKVKVGDRVTINGNQFLLAPACRDDAGIWACATHETTFANNLQKDLHLSEAGEHEPLWYCFKHGPEVG